MSHDVFLSHNSHDKAIVQGIADWLESQGVRCFLDEQVLLPGDVLTDRLGLAIEQCRSAIVCLGPEGEGPWQKEEVDTLLNRSIKLSRQQNEFRLIPVLLPGADTSKIRWFLETRLWCDLSRGLADSESQLAHLKKAILGERGPAASETGRQGLQATVPGVAPEPEEETFNPYRGLEAFDRKDAPFFFGRTREIQDLAERLRDWRFACIVGPSGNGKSSLARAGLYTETADTVLPGIASWQRLTTRPGHDLLRSILNQLYVSVSNESRAATVGERLKDIIPYEARLTAASWAVGLETELQTFYAGSDRSVLIIIDQFEELFTHRWASGGDDDLHEAQTKLVLDALALLIRRADKRWAFVLTLRSDFRERCRLSPAFWELLEREHLSLPLDELNEEGWREAIKGPATRAGGYLEKGLVETMLKDVYRQRGSMPLLQLALQELWNRREGACLTHAAYGVIGGVANALQARAEKVLSLLATEDAAYEEIARNLFLRLTSPGEGVSDTRRRMDHAELDWIGVDPATIQHVVSVLSASQNRLIVTDDEAIEVTHEVLIRDCATIRGWIEQARRDIGTLRDLTHAAKRWKKEGRKPVFLATAGPLRALNVWIKNRGKPEKVPIYLTDLEREFWQASRATREQMHRDKRRQRQLANFARDDANRYLAEVNWQLGQQMRGAPFASNEVSPLKATWQLLVAAKASARVKEFGPMRNAILAAKAASKHLIGTMLHSGAVKDAIQSPDGKRALTLSDDRTARLWSMQNGQALGQPMMHEDSVWGGVFSPDGQYVLTWCYDGTAQLWCAESGQLSGQPMMHDGRVDGALFSSDGEHILTWSSDGTARIWNAHNGEPVGQPMRHDAALSGAVFAPTGDCILTWSDDGTARLWCAQDGEPVGLPLKHDHQIWGATFSPDGLRILTWGADATARVFSFKDGLRLSELAGHDRDVYGAMFSDDGARVLTWSEDETARLWCAQDGLMVGAVMKHEGAISGAVFSADYKAILTWSLDHTARLWNAEDGKPIGQPMIHENCLKGSRFSPDGQCILTWSEDGTARLWSSRNCEPIGEPMSHNDGTMLIQRADEGLFSGGQVRRGNVINGAVFSMDGKSILTWSRDGSARLWNAGNGQQVGQLMKHERIIQGGFFSADGTRVMTWSEDGTARLWSAQNDLSLVSPMRHESSAHGIRVSDDDKLILSWSMDKTARLWSADSAQPVGQPMRHGKSTWGVLGAVFSSDRERILTWSGDGTARLWHKRSGQPATQVMTHEKSLNGAAFSIDGERVLTWSEDGTARLWKASNGRPVGQPLRHEGSVHFAAFSPDGQFVLTSSADGTARLWLAMDGKPMGQPLTHDKGVNGGVFSADGRVILTWSNDGTARLWATETGQPLGIAMRHEERVYRAAFSEDGHRILTCSEDCTARLWTSRDCQPAGEPMEHEKSQLGVFGAVFSPNGKCILTWGDDGTARLWNSENCQPLGRAMKHETRVEKAMFSPDGERVLTLTWSWQKSGPARLWSTHNTALIGTYGESVESAVFCQDGRMLITGSRNGNLHVWDTLLDRNLTPEESMLELAVRSATKLALDGSLQVLTEAELDQKRYEWEALISKRVGIRPSNHQ